MRPLTALLLVSSFGAVMLAGQAGTGGTPGQPAFEVASVKHNTSGADRSSYDRTPRRFSATNIRLQSLTVLAYGIQFEDVQIVGGTTSPGGNCTSGCSGNDQILRAHFDVNATVPEGASSSQESVMQMLRTLLAERFNLRARLEKREIPVYALTVAREGRLGPQLRPSEHNCLAWSRGRRDAAPGVQVAEPVDARGRPWCTGNAFGRTQDGIYVRRGAGEISTLMAQIGGEPGRPLVEDRTGLTGNFEWELTYEIQGLRALVPGLEAKAPTIDIAVQEQLGLRLVPRTAPYDVLVIESVAMPTPN